MSDSDDPPRVGHLDYRVQNTGSAPDVWKTATKLSPQDERLGEFRCSIFGGVLRAVPVRRFASEDEARVSLEPLLRRWEAVIGLSSLAIRFTFEQTSMLARPQQPGGSPVEVPGERAPFVLTIPVEFNVLPASLPQPLQSFEEPADLRLLRDRFHDWRQGRDRLLAVAYFAYTVFTKNYGRRGRGTPRVKGKDKPPELVALRMNVEEEVIYTLNHLSSERVSEKEGRKALSKPDLSEQERIWVEAAMVLLALRMGEVEAGVSAALMTLKDLPALRFESLPPTHR